MLTWFQELLAALGFTPDLEAPLFPTLWQLLFGLFAALIAWLLIHRGQQTSAEENRRIERARILHDLDREYEEIMAVRCVVAGRPGLKAPQFDNGAPRLNNNTVPEADLCLFELVLTRHVLWFPAPARRSAGAPNPYVYINGARAAEVAAGFYVDTLTLHRAVSWSKRVASGLHARIIDRKDVCDMWRHILPWARNNRFSYMAAFFGVSRDRKEPLEEEKEEDKASSEPDSGKRLRATLRALVDAPGDALRTFGCWITSRKPSPFEQEVPSEWSGDIAPLYVLIRTVLEEAYRSERIEVLHFAGLDRELLPHLAGRQEDDPPRMDPVVRMVLGLPEPAAPTPA